MNKEKNKIKNIFYSILITLDYNYIKILYKIFHKFYDKTYKSNSNYNFPNKKYILSERLYALYYKNRHREKKEENMIKYIKYIFQKSLNNENHDILLKIAKAVYRLKFNQGLNNFDQESFEEIKKILQKKNISDKNKNISLARLSSLAIPKPSNNLEAFHNFNSIQYFIYKKDVIDKFNIKDPKKLLQLSPLFYQNGLLYINPIIKQILNNKYLKYYIKNFIKNGYKKKDYKKNYSKLERDKIPNIDEILKNFLKNDNLKNFIKNKSYVIDPDIIKKLNLENLDRNNISIDEFISKIDLLNETQILRIFFEYYIIEYNINHSENNYFINNKNFDNFCKLFNNMFDTIEIFNYDKENNLYISVKKYTINSHEINKQNKQFGQFGGEGEEIFICFAMILYYVFILIPVYSIIILLGLFFVIIRTVAEFLYSIIYCGSQNKKLSNTIVNYIPCILWNTISRFFVYLYVTLKISGNIFICLLTLSDNGNLSIDNKLAITYYYDFFYSKINTSNSNNKIKNDSNNDKPKKVENDKLKQISICNILKKHYL